jgi:tether containing UBX domain for GLUT4
MSAHVEVIATDLRRAKVKVTPGTFLVDVLREACRKLNLSSDKYLLKYVRHGLPI